MGGPRGENFWVRAAARESATPWQAHHGDFALTEVDQAFFNPSTPALVLSSREIFFVLVLQNKKCVLALADLPSSHPPCKISSRTAALQNDETRRPRLRLRVCAADE
jgi:hypothetical protein